MAKARPPASGGERDPRQNARRLSAGNLLQYLGAVLVSIGLGSLVNRLRKRSSMSDDDEKPRRHVTGSRKIDSPEETHRGAEAASDVEEEQAAKADKDAAIEAKIAVGHEPSDVKAGRLVLIGVVIAAIGAAISSQWMYNPAWRNVGTIRQKASIRCTPKSTTANAVSRWILRLVRRENSNSSGATN